MEATESDVPAEPAAAAPAAEEPEAAEPPAVKPLTAVSALRPGTSGHDLVVKARASVTRRAATLQTTRLCRTRRSRPPPQVVEVKPPVSIARPDGSSALIVEALVADATAAVVLSSRNAQGARAAAPQQRLACAGCSKVPLTRHALQRGCSRWATSSCSPMPK